MIGLFVHGNVNIFLKRFNFLNNPTILNSSIEKVS